MSSELERWIEEYSAATSRYNAGDALHSFVSGGPVLRLSDIKALVRYRNELERKLEASQAVLKDLLEERGLDNVAMYLYKASRFFSSLALVLRSQLPGDIRFTALLNEGELYEQCMELDALSDNVPIVTVAESYRTISPP